MTGFLHEKEFSRQSFLKGGGALIVGFSAAGSALAGKASAVAPTSAGYNPDLTRVDSFLTLNADNTWTIKFGQPEWGHGAYTGISMMVAEELDVDLSQVVYGRPDSWVDGVGGG